MPRASHGTDSYEVEWQFETTDLNLVETWLLAQPSSARLRFALDKDATQNDVYLDTEDWAVYRAGYGLRIRHSNGHTEATLKSLDSRAGAGPRTRREISQPVADVGTDILTSEGPVSERVRLLAGKRTLRPLFEIATRRRTFRAEERSSPVAEVALDDTRIMSHGSAIREFKRVEVEALGQASWQSLLPSFVAALAEDLGLEQASTSKFESGLEAAGLTPMTGPDIGPTVVALDAPADEFALAILRRCFGLLVAREPGTRLGEDEEELHQMRVTLRRLRAALSMFEEVLPPQLQEQRDDLRWLAQTLGEVRDLDVQLKTFSEMSAGALWEESNAIGELMQVLEASHAEARRRLLEGLDSERYAALLSRLRDALAPRDTEPPYPPVREFVAPILRKRQRKFRNQASGLTPEAGPAAYHAVRVRGKRLRYSVDFVRPLYDKPAKRMADAMAQIQDLLGEHQDATVTIEWLRSLAKEKGASLSPQTLLFMGELMARMRFRMQELRQQWPDAFVVVRKRWRRLRRVINRIFEEELAEEPQHAALHGSVPLPSTRRWRDGPFGLLRRRRQGPH